jgi:tetratricopeptide (TPR) repeat protein
MTVIDESNLRQISEELSNIGTDLAEKGLLGEAITILEIAVKLNPKDATTFTNLGRAYQDKGSPDKAIANYKRAIRLNPNLEDSYERLGTAYASKGLFGKAIAYYEHAIRLNPSDAVLFANIGKTCLDKGLMREAIAHLKRALELNPNSANTHNTLGTAYAKMGGTDEAIKEFKRATQLDPKEWLYHSNLGDEYYKKGMWKESIEEYKGVIELAPESAATHNNLGAAYAQNDLLDRALKEFEKATQLDPSLEIARENLVKTQKLKLTFKGKIPIRKRKTIYPGLFRDSKAYTIFNKLENELRIFLQEEMEQTFGKNWWRQKIPPDIQKDCLEKKTNEAKDLTRLGKEVKDLHPIYYSDFIHFLPIITKRDNWKQIFSSYFYDESWIKTRLQELNIIIRRPVAHTRRVLAPRDIRMLEIYAEDIFQCIRNARAGRKRFS